MNVLNLEECELLSDSKYRAYVTQVERALKAFEYTSEWADLISALGKLNKVLGNNIKYPVIPRRVTIGKRLAQCLHPALPSGVHLKVLETYDIIFKCIGTQRLASDLFTYGAGLFPLLGYAAMNVRPSLLSLYEAHFVALRQHVKPALSGLIMGLLPGLEDGSEYCVKTTHLLEDFCEGVEPLFFYGCLWECVLASSNNRLAAINYVLAHFNRKQSLEDQLYFVGTNINLLVAALCASLQDTNVLVQRSALDLLLCVFPMHCCHLSRADTVTLLTSAINVVLRRDMSLNRRLYAWLIGTDANGIPIVATNHPSSSSTVPENAVGFERQDSAGSEPDLDYFETYSKAFLVLAVKNSLREDVEMTASKSFDSRVTTVNLRPFKILMSLLDKPEIGSAILEDIFLDVLRCMFRECVTKAEQSKYGGKSAVQKPDERTAAVSEVVKTANLLLGGLEPSFIWNFIGQLLESTCSSAKANRQVPSADAISVTELCAVIVFLLDKLSVEAYKETQTLHLPRLLVSLTTTLTVHISQLADAELLSCLRLVGKILLHVQPAVTSMSSGAVAVPSSTPTAIVPISGDPSISTVVAANGISPTAEEASPVDAADRMENGVDDSQINADRSPAKLASDDQQIVDNTTVVMATTDAGNTSQTDDKQTMESDSFCDFVRFEGTAAPLLGAVSPDRTYSDGKAGSLLHLCIQNYVKLFETFVIKRIAVSALNSSSFRNWFYVRVPETTNFQQHSGGKLETADGNSGKAAGTLALFDVKKTSLEGLSKSMVEAFSSACQLLVDFSALPMGSVSADWLVALADDDNDSMRDFPMWLQQLLMCACCVNHFDVETSSISTMFDLIALAQSALVQRNPPSDSALPTGTTPVLISPLLTLTDLEFLNSRTYFYQMVAVTLWNYLDERWPECHLRAGSLLYQLCQLSPNPWTCEDIICSAMLSADKAVKLAAHYRFAVLWHLLRDKTVPSNCDHAGLFDRSLTVMLDSLQGTPITDAHLCTSLAQAWLLQAVERGDLIRVLEPLLVLLLHPDTARVSIQHVNVHKPCRIRTRSSESSSTVDEAISADTGGDFNEAKIFAISSEGGNVIYHVSTTDHPVPKRSTEDLQTYAALTSVTDGGIARTTRTLDTNILSAATDINFDRVDAADVTLRINPFGSTNSLDENGSNHGKPSVSSADVRNARRLSLETCRREGIFFDDNHNGADLGEEVTEEHTPEAIESGEISSDLIARQIIDELVARVINGEQTISNLQEERFADIIAENENCSTSATIVGPKMASSAPVENGFAVRDDVNEVASSIPVGSGTFLRERSSSQSIKNDFQSSVGSSWRRPSDTVDAQSDVTDNIFTAQPPVDVMPTVHPLHSHILLYTHKFDTRRAVYAFGRLAAVLNTSPRLVVRALTTSNVGGAGTPRSAVLQLLLARHRRSVLGRRFHGNDAESSSTTSGIRSSMFVEVLVVVCLYYVRSYYPNLLAASLGADDVADNSRLQVCAADVLTVVLGELAVVARSGGRGFATYISDLLDKCKVQRTVLHALVSSVHNARRRANLSNDASDISDSIVSFNDVPGSVASTTFQTHLLHLVLAVIGLEHQLSVSRLESTQNAPLPAEWEKFDVNAPLTSPVARFLAGRTVVQQPMFLLVMTCALRQQHMCTMHRQWISCVVSSMPYLGRALARFVSATAAQICRNLELLAPLYELGHVYRSLSYQPSKMPPDHVVMLLDGLSTICQYCLCDSSVPQDFGQTTTLAASGSSVDSGIFSSLASVFHIGGPRESTPCRDDLSSFSPRLDARASLLKMLPHILSSLTVLWKAAHMSESREGRGEALRSWWTLGAPKMIRHYMLELISPLALNHCQHLLAAVASVWNDRRQRTVPCSIKSVIPTASEDQLVLVDMISAIKLLSVDSLMQAVRQIIKQPPLQLSSAAGQKKRIPLEVGLLRFFHIYIQRVDESVLAECWPLLLSLLKEGLLMSVTPPALFLLLTILNEFLQRIPMFEERKDQKDLQEVAQKLLEACADVAGSSLEQINFFQRKLAVKPGPQLEVTSEVDDTGTDVEGMTASSPPVEVNAAQRVGSVAEHRQYSVQALMLLAEVTVTLLDVVYRSEEKERVVPLLSSILYNVFPYLKNHSVHNLPSYRACSQMLASLSSYQYTRRAWKREAFELMMEPSFFQMDAKCIESWRSVIDNLMTHDRTTFKDLLVRVNITQSSSLNPFSSREAEYEQRAQLLKRLSFTIFCSEIDQYCRHMPDIQEKLSDCLRLPAALSLQVQVFLCFRVLILRISPQHLTSLWPTIITELVRVMLLIEQDLTPDSEIDTNGMSRLSNMDSSWVVSGGMTGGGGGANQAWLQLYLAACKLLDLAFVLPGDFLPNFQLYRWAFVGESNGSSGDNDRRRLREQMPTFVPHVVRIARRMSARFGEITQLQRISQRPLLTSCQIASLDDLCGFFATVNSSLKDGGTSVPYSTISSGAVPPCSSSSRLSTAQPSHSLPRARSAPDVSRIEQISGLDWSPAEPKDDSSLSPMEYVEKLVLRDFLEPMPPK